MADPPKSQMKTVPAAAATATLGSTTTTGSAPQQAVHPPESKMMTVSAVARLMPSPPARVDSRNAKSAEPAGRGAGQGRQGGVNGKEADRLAGQQLSGGQASGARAAQAGRQQLAPPSPQPTHPGLPTGCVEVLHGLMPLVGGGGAVQALVLEALEPHVVCMAAGNIKGIQGK